MIIVVWSIVWIDLDVLRQLQVKTLKLIAMYLLSFLTIILFLPFQTHWHCALIHTCPPSIIFLKVKARMQHQRSLVISNTPKNKAIGPMLLLFSSPSVSNVPATLCSTTRRGASGNLWSYSFQPFVASTLDMLQTGLCNLCRSKSKKH